jgi:phage-related protein
MPETTVFFYRTESGDTPVLEWLAELRRRDSKAFANCLAKLRLLRAMGYELRRPAADMLRDGIYELRAKHGTVQYRMLYFFHGRNIAVVAHALTKQKTVPAAEIERAIDRRRRYEKDPARHRSPQTGESLDAPA